jgi:3-methyl-2-oxobutanoate hydroxymethyltransferase
VQYLCGVDVLGETNGHIPHHSRVYDNFTSEYAQLQVRRVKAFQAFKTDVAGGQFPGPAEIVHLKPYEAEAKPAFLADPRR